MDREIKQTRWKKCDPHLNYGGDAFRCKTLCYLLGFIRTTKTAPARRPWSHNNIKCISTDVVEFLFPSFNRYVSRHRCLKNEKAWKEQSWRKHWIYVQVSVAVKATLFGIKRGLYQHAAAWWFCFQNDMNHIKTQYLWIMRALSLSRTDELSYPRWSWISAGRCEMYFTAGILLQHGCVFSTCVSSWTETDAVTHSLFPSSMNDLLRHTPGYFPALSLHLTLCLLLSTISGLDHRMRGKKSHWNAAWGFYCTYVLPYHVF